MMIMVLFHPYAFLRVLSVFGEMKSFWYYYLFCDFNEKIFGSSSNV